MLRALILLALITLTPQRTAAQTSDPALLVADTLFITRDRELVASGNVEAFQNGVRLQASSIRYNESTGAMIIEGPILLNDGEGTVILADAAELDADFREGILKGARLVLNQQLQLAAVQIDRVDDRYNQLYKTAVTSCKVCDDGTPPLWQIRAKRVVHDEVEEQLYFDQAQFLIGDVPVFWLPRLRLPGPGVDRTTGFLVPSIRSSSELGTGLKIPYFIELGDTRDLTLTPYLSSQTRTLEFRYRQAFKNGRVEFEGAYSDDDLIDDDRAYLFGKGIFSLPRDFTLNFTIEAVTDDGYLDTYDFSDADRLRSELTISRARRDEYIRASFYHIKSLRDDEDNDTIPTLVLDGEYERRFFPRRLGGEIRTRFEAHGHRRTSDLATDSDDEDDIVDGRDVIRLSAEADWLRSFVLRSGLRIDTTAGIAVDTFRIYQDDTFPDQVTDVTPSAALTLRYPLAKTTKTGARHVLEPVAQLGWTGGSRADVPDDESNRVEFDQGNLLSLSRFPRPDARERSTVGAVGLGWSRFGPKGWDTLLTFGQVFRTRDDSSFTTTSGLNGLSSDLLVAGQVANNSGLILTGRGLFESDFGLSKAEVRGDYAFKRGRVGGTFVWLEEDEEEDRDSDIAEIGIDGSFAITPLWTASADWSYDVGSDEPAEAEFGLRYENECVSVLLSVTRQFTSSSSVEASTDFGFNIGLRGFSANTGTERYVRSCSN
ncbi:MAG: LPS assembly protein LptD [Sulfitobacter sp.]